MQLFFKDKTIADLADIKGAAVALGEFDSMHLAHTEIVKKAVDYAQKGGYKAVVYMFSNNPLEVIKGVGCKYINSLEKRMKILFSMGVDIIAAEKFDENIMNISPEDFVNGYLAKKLRAKYVVAGYNYRFGKGGAGDTDTLKRLCDINGISLSVVPQITYMGERISSTKIRELISKGDVQTASKFMGRYYSLCGEVICGNQIGGSRLGFPTANIEIPQGYVLPKCGVYISRAVLNGSGYPSVTNIGPKPTVCEGEAYIENIETHIDAKLGNLYGEKIEIEFYDFIREIVKFDTLDELSLQIENDREKMRSFFEKGDQNEKL